MKCWDGKPSKLTSEEASKHLFSTNNVSKSYTIGFKTNTEIRNTLKSEDFWSFVFLLFEVYLLIYLEGLLEHLYVHTENFQGENWTVSAHLLLGSLLIFSHVSHSSLAPILPILLLFYQGNESQKCCISARFLAICTSACFFGLLSQILSLVISIPFLSCTYYLPQNCSIPREFALWIINSLVRTEES